MKTRPRSSDSAETRDLLLRTAGPIFASKGFHATSVRQITSTAGVNLAAINYHFQDKQGLYAETLLSAHQAAAKMAELPSTGTPTERLRSFIQKFLDHLLDPKRPAWHGRLIAREMAEPSAALDLLAEKSIKPIGERIFSIVRDLMGEGIPDIRLRRVCYSVIGQCLYYVHCREMISRIFPAERGVSPEIAALAEHIFDFSQAGILALKRSSAIPSKAKRRKSK